MANHKSAIKRARQNDKRRARNTALRSKARTSANKGADLILSATSLEAGLAALRTAEKLLHKAVSKGVIPKERASRKVSRLAAQLTKKFKGKTASARA